MLRRSTWINRFECRWIRIYDLEIIWFSLRKINFISRSKYIFYFIIEKKHLEFYLFIKKGGYNLESLKLASETVVKVLM